MKTENLAGDYLIQRAEELELFSKRLRSDKVYHGSDLKLALLEAALSRRMQADELYKS